MTDLSQLLVGGIPLLIVIFGLVEFSKTLRPQRQLVDHLLSAPGPCLRLRL